jgi:phosphatidylethanolamine/phosphatidyl-N-methylethanolamine N-methyltransferase
MPIQQNERVIFIREFLQRPQQIGSVIPSSRFLEQRLVELAGVRNAKTVVELGSGTGGTTRAILRAMRDDAKLLSVEINPELYALTRRISDPRLIPWLGSATELRETMARHDLAPADAVISGIPFSTMDEATGARVLQSVSASLAPGGYFVAYQVRRRVEALCRPFFGKPLVSIELLNIPPIWVYRWQKGPIKSPIKS